MNVQTSKSSFIKWLTCGSKCGSEKPSPPFANQSIHQKKYPKLFMIFREDFEAFLHIDRQTHTHIVKRMNPKDLYLVWMPKNDILLHNMIPLIENRFCPNFFRFRWKKFVGGKVWLSSEIMQNFLACLEQF